MQTLLLIAVGPLLAIQTGTPSTSPASTGWSFDREVYACGTAGMSFEELAGAGVTVVSHEPWGNEADSIEEAKAMLAEAHRHGIKLLPYVSLYKVIDSGQVRDHYHTLEHPFWRELDLAKHPEWALIDESGNVRRPFDAPDYRPGVHQSCTNVAGLGEAYVRAIRNVMDLGADGVFVDNVHPCPTCFGPKFGKHQHLYPDKDNRYSYGLVLRKVYETVKSYGPDKIVMLNSGGGIDPDFVDGGDAFMIESYICTHAPESNRRRWHDKEQLLHFARQHAGKNRPVVTLSYLGNTVHPLRDDAFYCAAWARLTGFLWTANTWDGTWGIPGVDRPGNDVLRLLYRGSLGQPLSDILSNDRAICRLFANGLIAINSGPGVHDLALPTPPGMNRLCDLYSGQIHSVKDGQFTPKIPAESGRIFLAPDTVFTSYTQECALAITGLTSHLAAAASQPAIDGWQICDRKLRNGQGQVVVDTTQHRTGPAALRMVSEGQGPPIGAGQTIRFAQPTGGPIRVAIFGKIQKGEPVGPVLETEFLFQDGTKMHWATPPIEGDEWSSIDAMHDLLKPVMQITLQCTLDPARSGTCWFDDLIVSLGAEGPNLLANGSFDNGAMNEETVANLRRWLAEITPTVTQLQLLRTVPTAPADRDQLIASFAALQRSAGRLLGEGRFDATITRRLAAVYEYTGRLLSMLTGVTFDLDLPPDARPGQPVTANWIWHNPTDQQLRLSGCLLGEWIPSAVSSEVVLVPPRSEKKWETPVTLPGEPALSEPLTLRAGVSFDWPLGDGKDANICLVQTYGLMAPYSTATTTTAPQ